MWSLLPVFSFQNVFFLNTGSSKPISEEDQERVFCFTQQQVILFISQMSSSEVQTATVGSLV